MLVLLQLIFVFFNLDHFVLFPTVIPTLAPFLLNLRHLGLFCFCFLALVL